MSEPTPSADIIGRASATEHDPNTSAKFSFWLGKEVLVNPFDIVQAHAIAAGEAVGSLADVERAVDEGAAQVWGLTGEELAAVQRSWQE